ncbi:MAG: flagellar biosynthetic protein FliO [Pseudomonadota bacterium]
MLHWSSQTLLAISQTSTGVPSGTLTTALPDGFSVLANLVLVIGAIVAAAWIVARLRRHVPGGNGDVRVVASCALGQRERVLVVALGDEQIVVGVSAQGMVRLHEMKEPLPEPTVTPVVPFANRLQALRKQPTGEEAS